MKLIRVKYGKKDTPEKDKEYQVDGVGNVGTIEEYKSVYPHLDLEIVDEVISND